MSGRRLLALVALLACVAAGCSEAESEPAVDAASATSSSSTPPSDAAGSGDSGSTDPKDSSGGSSAAPAMPGRARNHTLKGAEAFIRHYIDLLNYAKATGNTAALRAAARHCEGCLRYERLYRSTYEKGGFMKSEGWKPTYVDAIKQVEYRVVFVEVDAPRMRYKLSAEDEIRIGRRDHYKLRFEVSPRGDGWVVTDFDRQVGPDDR